MRPVFHPSAVSRPALTDAELALLGTMPDEELAAKVKRLRCSTTRGSPPCGETNPGSVG
jgi:hypothetical protein